MKAYIISQDKPRDVRWLGRQIAFGFLDVFTIVIIFSIVIGYLLPSDSTDRSWWHRSNLHLYTDHATGLQYLGNRNSLTPRLDRDGKQMRDQP